MSAVKPHKWRPIDIEPIVSPMFREDDKEFQDEEWAGTELEGPVFDDFGVEPSNLMPRPTFETKRRPGVTGAHVVLQPGPKAHGSSESAPQTRTRQKRKIKAEEPILPSEVDEPNLPDNGKKSTPLPAPQQPWHTACEAPSCPIKCPHNFGLSPFELPSQLLPKHDLVATGDNSRKESKPGQKRKSDNKATAGKKRKTEEQALVDEHLKNEDDNFLDDEEECFLGRSPYMPRETDSAEARKVKGTEFTREDKKLLQVFYAAHGGKQQYYGFLGSDIKYQKHQESERWPPKARKLGKNSLTIHGAKDNAKTAKDRRDNSKSDYRILPHG